MRRACVALLAAVSTGAAVSAGNVHGRALDIVITVAAMTAALGAYGAADRSKKTHFGCRANGRWCQFPYTILALSS